MLNILMLFGGTRRFLMEGFIGLYESFDASDRQQGLWGKHSGIFTSLYVHMVQLIHLTLLSQATEA